MAKRVVDQETEDLKAQLRKKRQPKKITPKMLLDSSSTLVNLAATGHPNGCYVMGCYHYFVGDSGAGKTWLCLSLLAEAAANRRFKKYRLFYDASENGALMDMRYYFGDLVDRLEPPRTTDDGEPIYSEYLEEMLDTLDDLSREAIDTGVPFIFVEDSLDALGTLDDDKKVEEQKAARRNNKKVAGTMTDGKAKMLSQRLRRIVSRITKSGSILILISQTRDKMGGGFMPGAETKTRAGGRAPTFYATSEIWTSKGPAIKKTVRGKPRKVGLWLIVKVKKNRSSGQDIVVKIPLIRRYGVDDVRSCVEYLVEEKHWKKAGGKIKAKEFDAWMSQEDLIAHIEHENLEPELRTIVADVWEDIEQECAPTERKPRYGSPPD